MIAHFTLRLIAGLAALWTLLPRPLITSGYFRIQCLVTLGLSVLGALTASQWEMLVDRNAVALLQSGFAALGAASFVGSVLWTLERRRGATRVCLLIAAAGLITLAAIQFGRGGSWTHRLLWTLDTLSAALLLGSLTGAMLLGHWHLTATAMSLQPLNRAVRIARWGVVLRMLAAGVGFAAAEPSVRGAALDAHIVWLLLRWLAGLAGPLVLTFLTLGTLKHRNTQSATGVLFAAVILAFIGESAAMLLAEELDWPL